MAFRATDVTSSDDVNAAAVLDVAGGAVRHVAAYLVFVVHRAVVARKASCIDGLGREFADLLGVARSALLVEDRVWLAHAAAGIDARVAGEAAPGDPADGEQWGENDQDEPGAFERSGTLEIVQVNALRDCFGCACSGQRLLAIPQVF